MQALVASVQDVVFDIETALEMQLGVKPLPFSGMDKSGSGICTFHLKSICDIGSTCPFRHVRADRSVVCKHWLRGLCKKGDDCEFLHEYDMAKMPECYFFEKFGECGNKECPFRHIDPESKRRDCAWYDRGFCRHGPTCKNRHVRRVMCQNYLCGFCPKGPACKNSHPKWALPGKYGDVANRVIPTCHHCGEVGHVVYRCFKATEEDKVKYQQEHAKKQAEKAAMRHHRTQYIEQQQKHTTQPEQSNTQPTQEMEGQASERPYIPIEDIKCYKCGEAGHFANRCPKGHLAFISLAKNQSTGGLTEQ